MRTLLRQVADHATDYLEEINTRRVAPDCAALRAMSELDSPLPEHGADPAEIFELLATHGSPATIASAGPRYFGFVTGGTLPAALAANWLAGAWDQNAFSNVSSPVGAAVESIATKWLLELLNLPAGAAASFVTGATMANFAALAAARHRVLERAGWPVEEKGLFGAPEIKVVVGEHSHATLFKALGLLGMGRARVVRAPADDQGAMRVDTLPPLDPSTILCLQAGNVNTGAFDPAGPLCEQAEAAGAWVHVDGAFGLWAAAAPPYAHLMEGFDQADSWAVDGHKWLNVPYDSGLAFVRDPTALRSAMAISAAYLPAEGTRDPYEFTPESSRRMRGLEVWAAIRSLGRSGVADLVERNCRYAQRFAQGLEAAGFEILNKVVLNQVLVSFGDRTERVVDALQAEGTCWCGLSRWQNRSVMRISVSSWATTERDVEQSLESILRSATKVNAG